MWNYITSQTIGVTFQYYLGDWYGYVDSCVLIEATVQLLLRVRTIDRLLDQEDGHQRRERHIVEVAVLLFDRQRAVVQRNAIHQERSLCRHGSVFRCLGRQIDLSDTGQLQLGRVPIRSNIAKLIEGRLIEEYVSSTAIGYVIERTERWR